MEAGLGRGPPMEAGFGRGGIEAGLGRGIPSGRGPRGPPPGVMPNGLLPPLRVGRSPRGSPRAGRSPRGAPVRLSPGGRESGLAGRALGPPAAGEPGRGGMKLGLAPAGEPAAPSVTADRPSRCACCATRDASCSAFNCAARASDAATSMSWALATLATGLGGTIETGERGFDVAAPAEEAEGFLGGAGFAATLGASSTGTDTFGALGAEGAVPAANASLRRRATGASTVLDADFTNSPISLSLASTFLLSTPSSFASSCTRALPATALLIPRPRRACPRRPHLCT
jgi:hypothetical protein